MSRRSALPRTIDVASGQRPDSIDGRSQTTSYPRTPRRRAALSIRTRLTSEVVELAFDHCESPAGCERAPDAICLKCGALSCRAHGATAAAAEPRRCAECGGKVADLLTAAIDLVLDARFRRG